MKIRLSFFLLTVVLTQAQAQPMADRDWSRIWGSTDADYGYAVTLDRKGHVYVAGSADGAFDGQPLPGTRGIVLSQFDLSGSRQWTRIWGPKDQAVGRAAIPEGTDVLVAGQTLGSMEGQPVVGGGDFFLTRWSDNGSAVWTRIWGSTGSDGAYGVTVDDKGDILVAGNAGEGFDGQKSIGRSDLCLSKLKTDGSRLWTRLWGSQTNDYGHAVATDSANNIYVCGYTEAAFDGQTFAGARDLCLTKFSADGTKQWTRIHGGAALDTAYGVAVDGQGGIYVAGMGGAFNGQQGVGGSDAFLVRLNANGVHQWTRLWGSVGTDGAWDVKVADDGLVYVAGQASSAEVFDGQTGSGAFFLSCFDGHGNRLWTERWGPGQGIARGLALWRTNQVMVAGTSVGEFDRQKPVGDVDLFLSAWTVYWPPHIVEGPVVTQVTDISATIWWKTDKDCDSEVFYGRSPNQWEGSVADSNLTQDHTIVLTGLEPLSKYRYQAVSTDSDGRSAVSEDAWFDTLPLQPVPAVTNLTVLGASWPFEFHVDTEPEVDRVEFSINGKFIGTAYGPPFNCEFSPAIWGDLSMTMIGRNQVTAAAFNDDGQLMATTESIWDRLFGGFPTALEIEEPYRDYTIYTDGFTSPTHSMLIRVYAAFERLELMEGPFSEETMGVRRWYPLTNGEFRVKFHVDGNLVHTSTNGLAHDPYYHEYTYVSSGLDLGSHSVFVQLIPPENYNYAGKIRSFQVERRHPDLSLSREVRRNGNVFEVTLTIHNDGSDTAELGYIQEPMTGFQACCAQSSLLLEEVNWEFSLPDKEGTLELGFGANSIPAGASRIVSYLAVPVLFRNDCDYEFGGTGYFGYTDPDGMGSVEGWRATTSYTSPWASRRSIADAVEEACHSSDYLLITDPVSLGSAYTPEGTAGIMVNMGELASLRNGVLGYYHTVGMIYTAFRRGGLAATGDIFRPRDDKDQVFIGHLDNNRIYCYSDTSELTVEDSQLPIPIDLRSGDAMGVGNLEARFLNLTNYHSREEVVVAWGGGHGSTDEGRTFIYQFDYDTNNLDHWEIFEIHTSYSTGDKMAIGEVWSNPDYVVEDIIVANADGDIRVHFPGDGTTVTHFSSAFRSEDHFAVGNVAGDAIVEMVVGDISANRIKIYQGTPSGPAGIPTYALEYEISLTLDAEDGLAVGDVLGDALEDIVVADASEGRITVYVYEAASDRFVEEAHFSMDYDADDELATGYVNTVAKEQILVLRGTERYGRAEGTVEMIHYDGGIRPGDRWALDRLIDHDGNWASQMSSNWASEGYLLLVGENDIIPAFTKSWDLGTYGNRHVEYTDRNYASTDSASDNNVPELSAGRIVGNSWLRLSNTLATAIQVAREPWRLNNTRAYVVSGTDEDNEDRFVPLRDSIADKLRDRGFTTLENHATTDATFMANSVDRDIIFLAGHGSPFGWDWPVVTQSNIFHHFDPGDARPLVFGASCLTGRYADGGNTLSEQFLWKGASSFIGATENSFGIHLQSALGWGPRLAEAFISRLQDGRPVGRSWTLAKRYRLSDAANTYSWDWNRNRYHCAIYHLYGDPKAEIEWTSALDRTAGTDGSAPEFSMAPLAGPVSSLRMHVPKYVVTTSSEGYHSVEIPGGEQICIPDYPVVPFYAMTVEFPKGSVVQEARLEERGGFITEGGLKIPLASEYIEGTEPQTAPAQQMEEWWPDREYDWSVRKNTDGSSLLTVKAYAFYYEANSGEARFYSNYLFGVDYVWSPLEIWGLKLNKQVYTNGEPVLAMVYVSHTNAQPMDVVIKAAVTYNDEKVVANLPPRLMPQLVNRGWCQLQWDTDGHPDGEYRLEIQAMDNKDQILDRAQADFQLGSASGRIAGFDMEPRLYQMGDEVTLSAAFGNTGSTSLDGTLIILVQDAYGQVAREFREAFENLQAGSSYLMKVLWAPANLVPRNCRIVVYAQFEGQTTVLTVGADWKDAPLLWDSIRQSDGTILVRWPSVAGRTYSIYHSGNLLDEPFTPLVTGLEATPPQNLQLLKVSDQGYLLLREDW